MTKHHRNRLEDELNAKEYISTLILLLTSTLLFSYFFYNETRYDLFFHFLAGNTMTLFVGLTLYELKFKVYVKMRALKGNTYILNDYPIHIRMRSADNPTPIFAKNAAARTQENVEWWVNHFGSIAATKQKILLYKAVEPMDIKDAILISGKDSESLEHLRQPNKKYFKMERYDGLDEFNAPRYICVDVKNIYGEDSVSDGDADKILLSIMASKLYS